MEAIELSRLCQRLGYSFTDPCLLKQALTHRSANRRHNNERLEFLGDAELGRIVSRWLFERFPEAGEGQLTRMRSLLVRGATLAEVARELALGDHLVLGGGEMKSGGHRRDSILADALEALVGAILLEGGEQQCRERVLDWFAERLAQVSPDTADKDAKTRLQEHLQAFQQPLPDYQVVAIHGQAPDQRFDVQCHLPDQQQTFVAQGTSRRRAEQAAAQQALAWLEEQP
ncbi:ribonuclease III [Isoalcanivorax beigongshangi]|uniref:Ribonuclease 3 n=1 Tax=Isoalcanivorax beigongshangi TaxID=3238810 RepID=A0ABV4AF26_9GAMM